MRRLPVPDAAWLLVESREQPMHVGGLQLFALPDDAPPTWVADLVAEAMAHDEVASPFNRRLARPYGRAGLFHWVEDEVDLPYHVQHLALPEPGRIRELLSYVSRSHSALLDRQRPLWELTLLEGIEDGRIAVYSKVHHSMLDGVAAMRQVTAMFSPDPDARDAPPPWAAAPQEPERVRAEGDATSTLRTVLGTAAGALGQAGSALGALKALAGQVAKAPFDAHEVAPFAAPRSLLNQRLTAARRFVAQDYPLERIKQVAKATETTVNDVVLSMCGGAVRTYLLDLGALPDDPLVAMVPVSIRPDDGSASGNALSFALAELATDADAPLDRLARVHASMERAKARLRGMSQAELVDYAILLTAPLIGSQLLGIGAVGRPLFNLTISNVPGPAEPLYYNGARMTGMYPVSLLFDGYGLNITQASYAGQMAFGITADRTSLPHVQRLIDHLGDELEAMATDAGV
ncbi:MAG: WS/DGAT/MGAT family O-acyltransferase [Actinomycetes bacterium]